MNNADNTLELLINLGFIGADQADAARRAISGVTDETKDASKASGLFADASKSTGTATDAATEKFGSSRREIRMLGNELGRVAGVSGMGMLFLGGVAAAAFTAAKALGFLKWAWSEVASSWKPLDANVIPPTLAAEIDAVTTAWNAFAAARTAVIAAENTPQAQAGREEKRLQNELKLIKEVLAAEREKAMIEAGSDKEAQQRVKEQFDHAGKAADEATRQKQIKVKEAEKARLEADAQRKYADANAIPVASPEAAEDAQATLDKNAAAAETLKKEIEDRLALIERWKKFSKEGADAVAEYTGAGGFLTKEKEGTEFQYRYGNQSFDQAEQREKERMPAVEAAIKQAAKYKQNQAEMAAKKKKLLEEAGTESGQAEVLSNEIAADKADAAAQADVDAHGRAGLPQPTPGGTPTGTSAAPGPDGPVPYEKTPEGMARHDVSLMEQYAEFTRQGGQLDKHQQDILKGMVNALVGHNATNREIKEALDEVLGTHRERDAIFQSFRRELQEIKNGMKTSHY